MGEPMASPKTAKDDPEALRTEWLNRLSGLILLIKGWAEDLDWSTRRIQKKMKDSRLGKYEAPALLMQKDTTRVLLDPIARFSPGGRWGCGPLPDAGIRRHCQPLLHQR